MQISDQPSPRRRFLQYISFGVATSVVGGKLWQREVMAYCVPLPDQKEAVFKVKISDYPALLNSWGSVRLGVNPVRPDVQPFPDGSFYPILINRDDSDTFYVLDTECRHASCVVPTFDSSEMGIRCPCHGSFYWISGDVINGPAQSPLHTYPFEFDGVDVLTIRIPCWGFETRAQVLPGGFNSRIKLEFNANANATYEVSFCETLKAPWTVASFSTTAVGPANQTSLTSFGGTEAVYLDRSTSSGFYAVGMKLTEV